MREHAPEYGLLPYEMSAMIWLVPGYTIMDKQRIPMRLCCDLSSTIYLDVYDWKRRVI